MSTAIIPGVLRKQMKENYLKYVSKGRPFLGEDKDLKPYQQIKEI